MAFSICIVVLALLTGLMTNFKLQSAYQGWNVDAEARDCCRKDTDERKLLSQLQIVSQFFVQMVVSYFGFFSAALCVPPRSLRLGRLF